MSEAKFVGRANEESAMKHVQHGKAHSSNFPPMLFFIECGDVQPILQDTKISARPIMSSKSASAYLEELVHKVNVGNHEDPTCMINRRQMLSRRVEAKRLRHNLGQS